VGQLVEGSSTTDVAVGNGITAAERARGDLVVEDAAVVDVCGRNNGICDNARSASAGRIRAAQNPCARILVCDGGEFGNNARGGVSSEIPSVKRIESTAASDVRNSQGCHLLAF